LVLAAGLALLGVPVSSASAGLTMEASPGAPTRNAKTQTFSPGGEDPLDPITSSVSEGEAPQVTLNSPPLLSNDTTPSFSGTASDTTPVTVNVYEGARVQGAPLATLKARVVAGSWRSASVSPPLANGKYTAAATQPSSLGTSTGASNPVTFEVDTQSPAVTLISPASPSNDTMPTFSGTASEATPVTVEIFEGTVPEGSIAAILIAPGTRGSWTSGPVTPALPEGKHTFTAVAVQTSEVNNAAGKSAAVTFVVDTEPPTVTLDAPPSPSNDTTPPFSGTATDVTPVTVEVFKGAVAEGSPVATTSATGTGGSWTSSDATPPLSSGTFTALATQPSAIGNAAGKSKPVTFVIDTSPPTVTLKAPISPSGNRAPSFSGTASDHTPVTVDIYQGTSAEGAVVASAPGEADRGRWVSAKASPPLTWGEYTAVARQPSSIGNPSGASPPATFAVEPIAPAVATEAASSVTRTSAALYASVDPAGAGVSACYFEYGPTTSYGRSIECGFVSELSAFPPSGTAPVPVFVRIYGLSPATSYHFRIVAAGEGGTAGGADATFTTLPPWTFEEPGSSGARSAPSSASRGVSAGEAAALIAVQLTPRGRAARIASLLRSGVFKTLLKAPEAGTAMIYWYYLPRVGRRSRKTARSPVLVASGGVTFHAAGTAALNIHLAGAGWRMLRASRRLRLTATCIFTPAAATPVRASATFELR
jgi:hypothetical protein